MTDSERIQAVVRDAKEILANKDQYTGSLEDLMNLVTINTCILAAQSATEEQALDIFWLLEMTVAKMQKPTVLH